MNYKYLIMIFRKCSIRYNRKHLSVLAIFLIYKTFSLIIELPSRNLYIYIKLHQSRSFDTDKSITYSYLINEGYLYLLTPVEAQLSLLFRFEKYLNASPRKHEQFYLYFSKIGGFRALSISVNVDKFRFLGYIGRIESPLPAHHFATQKKEDNLTRPVLDDTVEYPIIEFYHIMKHLFTNF
jgi:hypothetical protein